MDDRLERYIRSKCRQHRIDFHEWKRKLLELKRELMEYGVAPLDGLIISKAFQKFEIGIGDLRQIRRDSDLILQD